MVKLKNLQSLAENQTAVGIPIAIDVKAEASGSITRGGEAVEQSLEKVKIDQLVVGARLYHLRDGHVYEVSGVKEGSYTIRRDSDGAEYGASFAQIKRTTLLVRYKKAGAKDTD